MPRGLRGVCGALALVDRDYLSPGSAFVAGLEEVDGPCWFRLVPLRNVLLVRHVDVLTWLGRADRNRVARGDRVHEPVAPGKFVLEMILPWRVHLDARRRALRLDCVPFSDDGVRQQLDDD